jgi:hypothetical protein
MTKKVFALDTKSGVQRDGTTFDKQFYADGRWVRFQRGRPRKMGGYREITNDISGPSRGVYINPQSSFNYVFNGYQSGIQVLPIDNNGVGSGITNLTLSDFTASANNLYQFDAFTDTQGSGNTLLLAHPGQNLNNINSTVNTPVLSGPVSGTSMSAVGVFTDTVVLNSTTSIAIATTNILIGAGQTVTGTGIPASTTVVSSALAAPILNAVAVTGTGGQLSCTSTAGLFVGQTVRVTGVLTGTATGLTSGTTYFIIATNYTTTFTLSASSGGSAIVTTAGTTDGLVFTLGLYQNVVISNAATTTSAATVVTFDNQIDVSGGVVVLHPYVFVYGNDGLLRNCSSGNLDDWVSADANAQNVATGKIVQGLPVRGGSNSPSGLFWSLDSLIRVSYNPTTINVGGTAITQFWRYDTITSQSSILSSQCVIEYDGIYYWIGTDRFMLYNGVVKEIPNMMNQNYFFDNLNYTQRQKVWATKVPRFGEVWWHYPRGDSTECNDAIIYNVRENVWYDAGTAVGARRSAGFFSQVFRFPIAAGWEPSATGGVLGTTITNGGSGYTNGTYSFLPVTGGSGSGATATVTVAGGIVTVFTIQDVGVNYVVGDTIAVSNATLGGGSGLVVTVNTTSTFVPLWQHEIGTDAVSGTTELAIESYFETSDIGWVSGGPAQPSPVGENKWLHIERIEPDFVQSGEMECYVIGRPFAQSEDKTSDAFVFESDTNKIDMREQRRELRLRFVSNVSGGNYQAGRIIISADFGDVRGY